MNEPYRQTLPDLAAYRRELIAAGAPTALPPVPFATAGLLAQLPAPPAGRNGWPWTVETPPPAGDTSAAAWPLLTIVTPSFKQADFLEETIRSVLLQNYPRLEFIIVDGGSPDASPALIEKYRPWLSFARVAPDRGQSHAINLGFSLAQGDLRGWLNSDDLYLPGALHRIAAAFRSSRRPTLITGGYLIRGEKPGVDLPAHPIAPAFAWEIYAGGRHLPSHATFWSVTIHQPVHESLRFIMDADLFKRLARDGARPAFISEPLAVFRLHPDSKTSTIITVARQETTAWLARAPRRIAWLWRAHLLLDFARRVRARLFG
ncbi:MAG: glycosyltransferase [Undibacterium sp.]|nr:glycosyltransferase [Opitutaceae bacterium]